MSSQMGRPKTDNPKSKDLKVRVDEDTHEKLVAYCKKVKITKAEAVRKGIDLLLKEKNRVSDAPNKSPKP